MTVIFHTSDTDNFSWSDQPGLVSYPVFPAPTQNISIFFIIQVAFWLLVHAYSLSYGTMKAGPAWLL